MSVISSREAGSLSPTHSLRSAIGLLVTNDVIPTVTPQIPPPGAGALNLVHSRSEEIMVKRVDEYVGMRRKGEWCVTRPLTRL